MKKSFTKITLLAILAGLTLAACGGSNSSGNSESGGTENSESVQEDDCGGWTRTKPASQSEVIKCGDWEVSIEAAVNMPDSLILGQNSLNDVPKSGGKTVVVRLKATYNGSGSGDLYDVFGSGGGLIGLKGVRYEDNDPCCGSVWDAWADENEPFEGGTVMGNLFFITEPGDGEYLLALDFDSFDDVKAWISITPIDDLAQINQ